MDRAPHWTVAYEAWRLARRSGDPKERSLFDRFARSRFDAEGKIRFDEHVLGLSEGRVGSHSIRGRLEAREVASDVLLWIWDDAPDIDTLLALIYMVAHRRTLDAVRRIIRDRHVCVEDADLSLLAGSATSFQDEGAMLRRIAAAIAKLSPRDAYLITRIDIDGVPVTQVAEELDMIFNTAVVAHNRAKARFVVALS